ncbi:hypothetical protein PIROE2DRAFT_11454 [Piromyces sp. E2]|nr:hypothetical protein PIROE2DRAFT_11454 [Piromyces sp. E2]|eukprot:OUM62301.1 hypothetical protein PIROE2DRAFT_11454 [Piromyces sp. E2]
MKYHYFIILGVKYNDIDRKVSNSKEVGEPNVVTYAICIVSDGFKCSWTSCRFPFIKELNWAIRVSSGEATGCICVHICKLNFISYSIF